MRLIIVAAVHYCTERCQFLDHRRRKALSKGAGTQLHDPHFIDPVQRAGIFIRQVDAGTFSKAKNILIFTEDIHAHVHTDRHHTGVAGVFQHIPQRLLPVNAGTVDRILLRHRLQIAVAGNAEVRCDTAAVERRRHHDRLVGGAKLERLGNTEVVPHLVQRLGLLLVRHRLQILFRVPARQILWVI